MKKLSDHGLDVYSQSGEDGIVGKIFDIIGTTSKVCVEFGAWDGFYLSNTANLWARQGWKGVLIEMDPGRFKELVENTKQYNCRCIAARVENDGANTLENILKRESITEPIDLLSIDVDGDDYHIFKSLGALRPRLIICEYNPTVPPQMDLVPEPGSYFGCSILSLSKLAEKKGYKLVAVANNNCFFVQASDFPRFADYETSLPEIAVTKHLTYLITGYAGDYLLSREPTYGCNRPATQKMAQGEHFLFPGPHEAKVPAKKRRPKMVEKLRKKMGNVFRDPEFKRLSHEARELHATWEKAFLPVADQFLHPLWQKARPAFTTLIQNGLPEDFLSNAEVAHQFCRSGFKEPQQHELNYLRSRPRAFGDLIRRYRESGIGRPAMECREFQISANSLGMLYYFVRIAESTGLESLHTIAEFGGGYGCLCRVFLELLPRAPTYIIIDLPEMLALQYVFLKASSPEYKVVPHTAAPLRIEPGAVNLVPVYLADSLPVRPDLFVSTFALSETPWKLQEKVARHGFFGSKSVYLVGQETDTEFWKHVALDSPQALHRAVHDRFGQVRLQPYHFACAWELFAAEPKS